MKKVFLFFVAVLFVSAVITSCSKDDDGPSTSTISGALDVKVEGGSAFNNIIDEVKLIGYNPDTYSEVVLATAKYSDGGFKIDLPETPSSGILQPVANLFADGGDVSESVKISNTSAKAADVYLYAYDADGDEIGSIYCYKETGNLYVALELIYADSDVTITGSETYEWGTTTFSASLKKGWNQAYYVEKEVSEEKWEDSFTTTPQSGLKWVFDDEWH